MPIGGLPPTTFQRPAGETQERTAYADWSRATWPGPRPLQRGRHGPAAASAQQFEAQLSALHRLCDEAGRPDIEVAAGLRGIDEPLMAPCAELGVDRLVVIAPTHNSASLQSFLDQCMEVAGHIRQ